MRKNKNKIEIAVPPGETMKDLLDYHKISRDDFAVRMKMSKDSAEKLLNGEIELSPTIAIQLGNFFNSSAEFWLNLEKNYRDRLARGCVSLSDFWKSHLQN